MGDPLTVDLAIIGGGIIGLATALEVALSTPEARIIILEKEPQIAATSQATTAE